MTAVIDSPAVKVRQPAWLRPAEDGGARPAAKTEDDGRAHTDHYGLISIRRGGLTFTLNARGLDVGPGGLSLQIMSFKFANSRHWTPADVAIAMLAGTAVIFGILVAFIGFPVTIVPARLLGDPPAQDVANQLQTSGVGFVFLISGALTLLGLVRDSAVLTWVGAIAIAAYAGLGIFGIGALMIPVGLLLVAVLLLRAFLGRRIRAS